MREELTIATAAGESECVADDDNEVARRKLLDEAGVGADGKEAGGLLTDLLEVVESLDNLDNLDDLDVVSFSCCFRVLLLIAEESSSSSELLLQRQQQLLLLLLLLVLQFLSLQIIPEAEEAAAAAAATSGTAEDDEEEDEEEEDAQVTERCLKEKTPRAPSVEGSTHHAGCVEGVLLLCVPSDMFQSEGGEDDEEEDDVEQQHEKDEEGKDEERDMSESGRCLNGSRGHDGPAALLTALPPFLRSGRGGGAAAAAAAAAAAGNIKRSTKLGCIGANQ